MPVARRWAGPALGADDIQRLLGEAAPYLRPFSAYVLALEGRLGAEALSALNVEDVSDDGRSPAVELRVRTIDHRLRRGEPHVVLLSKHGRRVLARYLEWRRARCAHVDLPMRARLDADGVQRCLSCGDVMSFMRAPLFRSQLGGRLSPRQLRREFQWFRRAAGLSEEVHLDDLRLASRVEVAPVAVVALDEPAPRIRPPVA